MRLTVHVEKARKSTSEKNTKEGLVKFKQTFNTLSYSDVNPDDVSSILNNIKTNGMGTPTKHYLSNEKIAGHSRGKKK